jgi:hypothetical protein
MQAPQRLIGDRRVELPHRVVQQLQWGSLLLVRIASEPGQRFNRNIFAFDDQGRQLWQIAESPHGGEAADKPFMDLRVNQHGELIAGNWNGVEYRIDPKTGALAVSGFGK